LFGASALGFGKACLLRAGGWRDRKRNQADQ